MNKGEQITFTIKPGTLAVIKTKENKVGRVLANFQVLHSFMIYIYVGGSYESSSVRPSVCNTVFSE